MSNSKAPGKEVLFKFSDDVISTVISEIANAKKYIRIAIFQLHNKEVFELLSRKIDEGVKVEIFTLPYDSINDAFRERVTGEFGNLSDKGATLYFCKWNVGDPERTTTAVGRWYSYHGKFMVTDMSAIALSANFTSSNELDASIIFRDDQGKINEFNEKFDKLLNLFITPNSGFDGSLRKLVEDSQYHDPKILFDIPRTINADTHKNHWIKDYPSELCPDEVSVKDRLYVCPFDVKGRYLLRTLIQNSEKYLYISTESFTDEDILDELIRKKNNEDIEINILTGTQSRDFTDRLQSMLRQLLASGIMVRTTEKDLHAKLMISKGYVAVGSINFNKINLGFQRTSGLWRESTETITYCSDPGIVQNAAEQFSAVFCNSLDVSIKLAEKIEKHVGTILKSYYDLKSRRDAKQIFSRFILMNEIQEKKIALKIGRISKTILDQIGAKIVTKEVLLMAIVLFFLTERKHNVEQLAEKLISVDENTDLHSILNELLKNNYIEKEDEFYKLKIK